MKKEKFSDRNFGPLAESIICFDDSAWSFPCFGKVRIPLTYVSAVHTRIKKWAFM